MEEHMKLRFTEKECNLLKVIQSKLIGWKASQIVFSIVRLMTSWVLCLHLSTKCQKCCVAWTMLHHTDFMLSDVGDFYMTIYSWEHCTYVSVVQSFSLFRTAFDTMVPCKNSNFITLSFKISYCYNKISREKHLYFLVKIKKCFANRKFRSWSSKRSESETLIIVWNNKTVTVDN